MSFVKMSTPRTCHHCRAIIGSEDGYYFDTETRGITLRCRSCGGILFPMTWEQETEFDAVATGAKTAPTTCTTTDGKHAYVTPYAGIKVFPPQHSSASHLPAPFQAPGPPFLD